MLVREYALQQARAKMEGARGQVVAEKTRLETNPGLLMSLSGRGKRERDEGIKAAIDYKSHYDAQLGKIESLNSLLNKEITRWLDCCLKLRSPDYCVGLAAHDFPEDWSRFGYSFDVLIKAFQMGLEDLMVLTKGERQNGPRSEAYLGAVRKLLPLARLVEIDVEFLNKILAQRARRKGAGPGPVTQHPEYGWCETIEYLSGQPVPTAIETLRELVATSGSFLPVLAQEIKREQGLAEERVALGGRKTHPSYLKLWWEGIKPAAAQGHVAGEPEAVIAETEALLLDGAFAGRFNRYLLSTIVRSPSQAQAEPPRAAAVADAELKAMKEKLEAELEDVAKLKANLTRRERTLRENEQAFEEKRHREQAAIEEGQASLATREQELAGKIKEWEARFAAEQARLEALIAENDARVGFIEESEQRLLAKGQEQIERLAELEQREEELESTKRELNEMRKEMGLPIVPLRTKPVDEFSE